MTWDWLVPATEAVGVIGAIAATFISYGRLTKTVDALSANLSDHDSRIDRIEAAQTEVVRSVDKVSAEIARLLDALAAQEKLAQGAMARTTDSVASGMALIGARLDGLDQLSRQQLAQLQHDINGIRQTIVAIDSTYTRRGRTPVTG